MHLHLEVDHRNAAVRLVLAVLVHVRQGQCLNAAVSLVEVLETRRAEGGVSPIRMLLSGGSTGTCMSAAQFGNQARASNAATSVSV